MLKTGELIDLNVLWKVSEKEKKHTTGVLRELDSEGGHLARLLLPPAGAQAHLALCLWGRLAPCL